MMLLLNVHAAAAFSVATPMTTTNLFHDFDGHQTRYVKRAPTTSTSTSTKQPPVVLVHGFGGSAGQWRATIEDVAASGRTVYALDLLGFGMSPKPILPTKAGDGYSIELWSRQLQRFISEVVCEADGNDEAVIIGNSIGSLTCVCAASATSVTQQRYGGGKIAGVGLFNCAIGMNSKAEPLPTDPIAYAVFYNLIGRPLFILIDLLLKSPLSTLLFDKVRTKENVRQVLENGVYENGARVDEELVDMITRPAEDEGALDTFINILTGDPGPRPEALVPKIDPSIPIAVWWGPEDNVTPLIGVVGQFFKALPQERGSAEFTLLPGTGHCPFDDRPDLASPKLIEWLDRRWPA